MGEKKQDAESYVPIINRSLSAKLMVRDIVMIRRDNRKLEFYTDDGQEKYEMYERMDQVMEYLDDRFFACTNGCIINFEKVKSMQNQCVEFLDGRKVYIGRDNFIRARQKYNIFLRKSRKKP